MARTDQVLLVLLAALGMVAPLWFTLWCVDGFNDKPRGHHPVSASYVVTGLAAVATASLAWWLARRVARPQQLVGVYGLIACSLACF